MVIKIILSHFGTCCWSGAVITDNSPSEHPIITYLLDFDKHTLFTAASLATMCFIGLSKKGRVLKNVYPCSFP